MTEHDPLRQRFDMFQDESVRAATPPPVEQIPRLLRRRRRRTAGAALAAVLAVVLALVAIPSLLRGKSTPEPATSPTRAPSASTVSSAAAIEPPGGPSAGAAGSHSPTTLSPSVKPCTTDSRGLPLPPNQPGGFYLTFNDGRTLVEVSPGNLFDECPGTRITVDEIYYSWDIDRAQYTLLREISHVLTKAQPTMVVPVYAAVPHDFCGQLRGLLAINRGTAPTTVPRSVQDSPDPLNATINYMQKYGFLAPDVIDIEPYTTLMSESQCTPAASPTPSG